MQPGIELGLGCGREGATEKGGSRLRPWQPRSRGQDGADASDLWCPWRLTSPFTVRPAPSHGLGAAGADRAVDMELGGAWRDSAEVLCGVPS